jgi:tetratricopeptide (TPR) repeat protein
VATKEIEVAPLREASDDARKLAQEVIARRLRGAAMGPSSIPAREDASRATASDRTPVEDLRRQLGRAIKGAHELTSGGPVERVEHLLEASKRALARGDLQEATQIMRRAVSLAPERPDLLVEHEQLSKKLAEKLADDYAVQAQFEAKQGKWAAAALAWAKVCEGRPQDADAHRQTAFALFKLGGDLRSAQKYAQQATFLAPNDVDARVLLAQVYLTLGLKLNAKRELDTALKLDPGSEIVKNLLSDLKG